MLYYILIIYLEYAALSPFIVIDGYITTNNVCWATNEKSQIITHNNITKIYENVQITLARRVAVFRRNSDSNYFKVQTTTNYYSTIPTERPR